MRRYLLSLLFVTLVFSANLAVPRNTMAATSIGTYDGSELSPAQRKKLRRKQGLIAIGVLSCVGAIGAVVIGLNALERKKERQKLLQAQIERMENGLA